MAELSEEGGSGRREMLLAKIVDYVLANGISELTLRGLASAVGSNNRMLLYYFGSRDEIIVAALEGAADRFPGIRWIFEALDDEAVPLADRLLGAWGTISDPVNLPFHRLFFEIFGMAGFERQRFTALLGTIGTEWVNHVAAAFAADGVPADRSLMFAHEIVALWRGFQATLISMGDPAIVDRAARDATSALLARAKGAASS